MLAYDGMKLLRLQLYRTLGQFLCCSDVAAEQVLLVLDSILRTPVAHTNISQLIEFCCQITSHLPFVVGKLHHWARGVVEKEVCWRLAPKICGECLVSFRVTCSGRRWLIFY